MDTIYVFRRTNQDSNVSHTYRRTRESQELGTNLFFLLLSRNKQPLIRLTKFQSRLDPCLPIACISGR